MLIPFLATAQEPISKKARKKLNKRMKNVEKRDASIEETLLKEGITDFQVTEEGLYYTVEEEGTGELPNTGDFLRVHYTGTLLNGSKFDSSKDRNEPFMFQLGKGRVISGWEIGMAKFKKGGKGVLYIPAELGYGSRDLGDIPANSPLKFEVEILDVMDAAALQAYKEEKRRAMVERQKIAQQEAAKIDKVLVNKYIADNKLDAVKTPSGLAYVIEEEGTGPQAEAGKTVSVHYHGTLTNGTVFDSSFQRGEPIEFPLGKGMVIQGWEEGLTYFKEGGKGKLIIPSTMAYGASARGQIPANSVLIFDIELVGVK